MENKKEKSLISKIAPLAIGGAAAGLIYKKLRAPKITNPLQQAVNDNGLTIGLRYGASKLRKNLGKFFYSADLDFRNTVNPPGETRVFKKVLYNKNIYPASDNIAPEIINSNKVTRNVLETFDTKQGLDKLDHLGEYFPKTRNLKDALKEHGISPEQFKGMKDSEVAETFGKLNKTYGKQFLKPTSGQSMGKGTANVYAPLDMAHSHRKVKPTGVIEKMFKEHKYEPSTGNVKEIKDNLDKYIISDHLGEHSEVRVHTLNGKVVDEVRRFGFREGTQTKLLSDAEKQHFEGKLKDYYKAKGLNEKDHVSVAFDALRNDEGKIKLIEANPNSGFLFNLTDVTSPSAMSQPWGYASSHKMYKALTGKASTAEAGAKALGAGVAATTGTALLKNKLEKKSSLYEEVKKHPVITSVGVAGGVLGYKLLKKPKTENFFHLVPSNTNPGQTQGKISRWLHWGDIKHVNSDELKTTFKNTPGTVYNDLPPRMTKDMDFGSLSNKKVINASPETGSFLENKMNFNELPHHIKATPVTKEHVGKNMEEMMTNLKKHFGTEHVIIKPKDGYRSQGVFLESSELHNGAVEIKPYKEIYNKVRRYNTRRTSPVYRYGQIAKDPEGYIAQPLVKGKEFRVTSRDGNVLQVRPRHENLYVMDDKELENTVRATKDFDKTLKGKFKEDSSYVGHDVIIDKDKKPHFIESNTNEGFFWHHPNKLYKDVTGKDLPNISAKKSAIVGGVTYGAIAAAPKAKKKREL